MRIITAPPDLLFEPIRHEYRMQGQVIPSVTQVLEGLHRFDMVPDAVLQAAQQRGTDVHLACQYLDEGDLDEEALPDSIAGYVEGWREFLADYRPRFAGIETRVFHPRLRYAGTADRFAAIAGEPWVIDIKTAKHAHPVWGLQTAAYAHAAGLPEAKRATVRLRPGGYSFDPWSDRSDWPTFASALTLRTWLSTHNPKGGH